MKYCTYIIVLFLSSCKFGVKNHEMRLGLPGEWGDATVPHMQNNYYGSFVLFSAFDVLLDSDKSGAIVPSAAKDWYVSDDLRTYTFEIDTSKRFSDGSYLKASDFKNAWEFALKANPNAYNNNVGDVFYALEGIDDFEKTGKLSGLVVKGEDKLVVKFKKPFRNALDELMSARFAVSKRDGDKFIGTGKFIIEKNTGQNAKLVPNPYSVGSRGRPEVWVKQVNYAEAIDSIKNNEIDAYYSGSGLNPEIGFDESSRSVKVIYGQASVHSTLVLNGIKNRFFGDGELRKAFQYLIYDIVESQSAIDKKRNDMSKSYQVFLPYQYGHIEDEKVKKIINSGKRFVPKLIKESRLKPIVAYYDPDFKWIKKELIKRGVLFSKSSKNMSVQDVDKLNVYYKKFTPDVMSIKASFSYGDPDGLYHLLGKEGAITSPMSQRSTVADWMEKGRRLHGLEKLDSTYQKVTSLVLQEVPFVHLGFMSTVCLYNPQKLEPIFEIIDRNENFIDGFKVK